MTHTAISMQLEGGFPGTIFTVRPSLVLVIVVTKVVCISVIFMLAIRCRHRPREVRRQYG